MRTVGHAACSNIPPFAITETPSPPPAAWYANFTTRSSLISACSSPGGGGGLYLWHAYAEVYSTEVSNCLASQGGGIQIDGAA